MKRALIPAVAAAILLHFAPAHAQTPAAIAGEAFVLGLQTQTNGGAAGITSSRQRSSGAVNFDVSSVQDGAFGTQFGKGVVNHAGEAFGTSSGPTATGSSASMQGGFVAFTQFAAFPEAGFNGFAGLALR